MNIVEWGKACEEGWAPRRYDNASRKIQRSLKYNPDPKATVRHHLRDTEEQRKYNDEHYELWGFEIDENGNEHFEYGKYMIFVTHEEHTKIHKLSEETRFKLSNSLKKTFAREDQKIKRSVQRRSEWNDNRRLEYSIKFSGENNAMYGKKASEETKLKLSKSHLGIKPTEDSIAKRSNSMKEYHRLNPCTEETRNKISIAVSGENNPNYGREYSEFERQSLRDKSKTSRSAVKFLYSVYKRYSNILQWNDFQAAVKNGNITFEERVTSVYINTFKCTPLDSRQSKSIPFKITKDRAAMYKLYRYQGGKLKWNDFQSAYNRCEIHLNVINTSDEAVQIKTGEKLIQFMHLPILCTSYQEVSNEDFDKLKPESVRKSGGFGSSGTK